MFARTYDPEASCICSVASSLLRALWLTAAVPGLEALGPVLMHLVTSLLWASLPSGSALFNWHVCVPVACIWVGCCWEARVPWRSPWGPSKEAERRSGITRVHGVGGEEKERTSQRSAGSWAVGSRAEELPAAMVSAQSIPSFLLFLARCFQAWHYTGYPRLTSWTFFRHILGCASSSSQEMPSLSPHPSYLPSLRTAS